MSRRLEGKIALVMGAGSVGPGWGNGRAISVRFAEEGASIFGIDRELDRMTETVNRVNEAGGQMVTAVCDVTKSANIKTIVEQCLAQFGRIDILVNNVGGSAAGGPVEMTEEVFDSQINHNLKSVFLSCKHVLPVMEAQGAGSIINIASTAGKWGSRNQSAYNVSKHAVVGLTRCVALEASAYQVTVNAICPGFVETDMLDELKAQASHSAGTSIEDFEKAALSRVPLGRMMQPQEIAQMAVFLASQGARGMTGQSIHMDGGMVFS